MCTFMLGQACSLVSANHLHYFPLSKTEIVGFLVFRQFFKITPVTNVCVSLLLLRGSLASLVLECHVCLKLRIFIILLICLFACSHRIGQYEIASSLYREGLLHAPNAFHSTSYKTNDSSEAALLHGNLSACLAHQEQWAQCAWSAAISIQLSPANSPKIVKLTRRLEESASRLKLSFSSPQDCLNKLTEMSALTNQQLIMSDINSSADSQSRGIMKRYGNVCVPSPRYGRQELVDVLCVGFNLYI